MYKALFDFFTSSYNLLEDPLGNYILMGIVVTIAFIVAWRIVGRLYSIGIIYGREAGRILHWSIRLIVFIIIWGILTVCIKIVDFIRGIPTYLWYRAIIIVSVSFISIIIIKIVQKRKS